MVLFWRERGHELPSYCYGFGGTRQWLHTLALAARCRHEIISSVDESLDMANAFGSLDRKNTEDVLQPEIARD